MKITPFSEPLEKLKADCLALGIFEDTPFSADLKKIDSSLGGEISHLIKSKTFTPELNEACIFPTLGKIGAKRLLLIGLGKKSEFSFDSARQAAATAVQAARSENLVSFAAQLFGAGIKGPTTELASAFAEGAILGAYAFETFKTKESEKGKKKQIEEILIVYADKKEAATLKPFIEKGQKLAEIINYCRELANLPANIATPAYLANESEKLSRKCGFKATIYDKKGIEKLGFNALLAVNAGSSQEPRFVVLEYKHKGSSNPLCLVGKTITFDSGGLNLKGEEHMQGMKYDKCGGISVLGTVATAAALELPVHLIGLLPITENLPSGSAFKVGDIYKAYNGVTMEIVSTDAEGRVILSDALAYAKEFKPKAIIDLATLTGSCVVALGTQAAGIMGNDKKLLDKIKEASEKAGERVWELPMFKEYEEQIKSDVADVKNIGENGAGTITAAKFLEKFVPHGVAWAHIDTAGTAWTGEKGKYKPYVGKGATGYGVRLLIELLKSGRF